MNNDLNVIKWTMIEGMVTEYKIDNKIWIIKPDTRINKIPRYMTSKKHGQTPKIVRWIKGKKIGKEFTIDEYYAEFPKERCYNTRNEGYLSDLAKHHMIQQVTDADGVRKIQRLQ